ncbi:hypothetical protein FALBO_9411 [Fusarium albosuccineum]|uniref:Uncharacterized protein n=1 Tax=Fusarium albosuccineum TaxID=1237068 RepID=A0A8H4L636_9HYPO|nr:hypothetical protein FALBO_9411 [Fusarium albosuccineum]
MCDVKLIQCRINGCSNLFRAQIHYCSGVRENPASRIPRSMTEHLVTFDKTLVLIKEVGCQELVIDAVPVTELAKSVHMIPFVHPNSSP